MRANQPMRQWMIKILMWLRPRIQSVYTYFGLAGALSDAPAAVQTQTSGNAVPGAHQSPPYPKSKMQLPGAHAWIIFALLLLAPAAHAQQGGQTSSAPPLTGSVAPTGNCGVGSLYVNTTTGDLYDCNAGAWNKVNGGGSGAFSGGLGSSFQDGTEIAAPANPAAGNDRLYLSSTTHLLACLTSSGSSCMPSGGAGTVTQVTSGNFSPLFNVSVATNTSTPAFSFAGISQSQNLFFASPNGSSGVGAFRAIAAADVPASANACAAHQFTISLASGLNVTCAQPVAADIGSIPGSSGQLLFNNAGAIGAEDPVVSANQPTATTQTITATGALTGVTVSADGMVLVTVSGTYAGVAFNFEASPDGTFSPAFPVTASAVDSVSTVTASGVLSSNATKSWFVKVAGHTKFRLNATAYTSGTANVTITPIYYQLSDGANVNVANTVPITAASLPLPTGAAADSSLTTIDTDVKSNVTLHAGSNIVGKVGIDQTTPGTTNAVATTNFPSTVDTNTGNASASTPRVAVATNNPAIANWGQGATGSAVPSGAQYHAGNGTGNLTGYLNCDNATSYDATTNGATQLAALTSSQKIYVCGFQISTSQATAVHVALEYGTGSNCATSPTKITPNYPLQAAASTGPIGMVVMTPGYTGLQTIASNELCIVTDAAVSVQAIVWWTKF
jgi:hypothetical protein